VLHKALLYNFKFYVNKNPLFPSPSNSFKTERMKTVTLKNIEIANDKPFTLIAGPCQMESRDHAMMMCETLKELTSRLDIPFIYKTSYDKANRTSLNATRGIGLDKAMAVFDELRSTFDVPMLTDVHTAEQCAIVAEHVDVLQIPAFMCRQTDLLVAAAKTGAVVNVKKGQFLAPWDMKNVAAKVSESGNDNILLTDRGTSFGYNTLVNDMRGLPAMAETGYPVIIDATHSVQQPGGLGGSSGGDRAMVPVIARAAVAVGVAGVFTEVHEDPENSTQSDRANMMLLDDMEAVLTTLKALDGVVKV
jgi:2-dehydro-3-deoxyphosphooctonate aldolase (KDO 8-P synthase)